MMNPQVKEKWVAALTSGKYQQGRQYLKIRDSHSSEWQHCCLGVLCELYEEANPSISKTKPTSFGVIGDRDKVCVEYEGLDGVIPHKVKTWAGLESSLGGDVNINGDTAKLTLHNDNGRTFAEIAKAIQEQL